ncbi:hypothetical protein H696_02557 [Fonticula alba]|uniref:Uncharacterized protein n=1 Tax=Fonticula alba TaxID=691883 RepID=A0A058Z9L9_FONAL|nr:hypothetical protein H696_02557 [Fonticula alba]KCV70227.1 hypothetical protein H696_02557 [Fonticula alba]|eukprot:XP_009494743.1 hypothetical protein H696_02557 [Fonticula alba]
MSVNPPAKFTEYFTQKQEHFQDLLRRASLELDCLNDTQRYRSQEDALNCISAVNDDFGKLEEVLAHGQERVINEVSRCVEHVGGRDTDDCFLTQIPAFEQVAKRFENDVNRYIAKH